MGKIIINKGDEYRAKIENDFASDIFFADVYMQADNLLRDMIKEHKKGNISSNYNKKYYRTGNNIISFCAERGQGKTSAIQSFARYLDKGEDNSSLKFDYNAKFVVLDSIDPSLLSKKESIVRVFISRLFYKFSEVVREQSEKISSKPSLREKRTSILQLFQQCFNNIDYLNNSNSIDDDIDDLDYLAQLGDSGRLRENLYELVENFLDFVRDFQGEFNDNRLYLVVVIDDADLSMGNIFKICEDIRNYLSVANMIVLMAADMEQLTYAIEREYIIKYRELIDIHKPEAVSDYYRNNCNLMACRYVEKMFPIGHRLELPKFSKVLQRKHDELKIEYYESEKDYFTTEEYELCQNMQQQLLKMLYDRTGIIFMEQKESLHMFLPHRLRELTHFIKFLQDMNKVDFIKAYNVYEDDREKDNKDLISLRKNIETVEEYFFEYWCTNRLNEYHQKIFRKIRKTSQGNREESIISVLEKYYEFKYDDSKPLILQESVLNQMDEELVRAIFLYYTIYYNKCFAYAIGEEKEWDVLVGYCQIFVDELTEKNNQQLIVKDDVSGETYRYNIDNFKISMEDLNRNQDKVVFMGSNWVQQFGKDVKIGEDGQIESMTFDMFHGIVQGLQGRIITPVEVDSNNSKDTEVSISDSVPASSRKIDNTNIVWNIKNIFANVEVYDRVCYAIENKENNKKFILEDFYNNIFKKLDRYWDELPYLKLGDKEKYGLGKVFSTGYNANSTGAKLVFLSNDENKEMYKRQLTGWIGEYRESIEHYLNDLSNHLNKMEVNFEELIEKTLPEKQLPLSLTIPETSEFKAQKSKVEKLRSMYLEVRTQLESEKHMDEVNRKSEDVKKVVAKVQQKLIAMSK